MFVSSDMLIPKAKSLPWPLFQLVNHENSQKETHDRTSTRNILQSALPLLLMKMHFIYF